MNKLRIKYSKDNNIPLTKINNHDFILWCRSLWRDYKHECGIDAKYFQEDLMEDFYSYLGIKE